MMDKTGVQEWARELVEANPGSLHEPDNFPAHLGQVYDIAEEIVRNVRSNYPNIPLDVEEIALAAGLHDIGRPLQKDQVFHELRGARLIVQEGFERGVADSMEDVYRIAQMVVPHGSTFAYWNDHGCAEKRKEFEPLDPCLLLPRSWQEAIVAYADMASFGNGRIEVKDRLQKTLQRYEEDTTYEDSVIARVMRADFDRQMILTERVEALEQGKLSEQDIIRYGFL